MFMDGLHNYDKEFSRDKETLFLKFSNITILFSFSRLVLHFQLYDASYGCNRQINPYSVYISNEDMELQEFFKI